MELDITELELTEDQVINNITDIIGHLRATIYIKDYTDTDQEEALLKSLQSYIETIVNI
jgi:hypothetical protein